MVGAVTVPGVWVKTIHDQVVVTVVVDTLAMATETVVMGMEGVQLRLQAQHNTEEHMEGLTDLVIRIMLVIVFRVFIFVGSD